MTRATHRDILRIFPGLPANAVAAIESMGATENELDAALMLLTSDDIDLCDVKQWDGDRLNGIVGLLRDAGVEAPDDDRDE